MPQKFVQRREKYQRKAGKCDLKVLKTNDKWHGVTYPDDKAEVVACIREMIASGVYPDGLWKL